MIDPQILREYDIRGLAQDCNGRPAQLTPAVFRTLAQALGSELREEGAASVCVAYDGRVTSLALEEALVEGLTSTGLHVIRLGLGPSPLAYFAGYDLNVDAALMVTGSHNPAEDNGLKITRGGRPYFGPQIKALGARAQSGSFVQGAGTSETRDLSNAYLDYLLSDYRTYYPQARALRIAWDPGHGATGPLLRALTDQLPGTHFILNEPVDGTFPAHEPDPTVAENLSQLIDLVQREHCDLGIAFDGDGDRIGVVDNKGAIIWGDQLLQLYAAEILTAHPGATIIADVKASQTLFEAIHNLGGTPLMWATGHSLIKAKMAEVGALLGGEMSGHIFFADRHKGFDDAMYAAIRVIGIVGGMNAPLSTWREDLPQTTATPEMRIPCNTQDKFLVMQKVIAALQANDIAFIDIDGVRVVTEAGWWLLRASNTQESLVARVEATNENTLNGLREQLDAYLSPFDLKSLS